MAKKTKRRSLFRRIAVTIGLVSISFQIFTLVVMLALVMVPLGKRATDDLAALLLVSAKTWAKETPARRKALQDFMQRNLGLVVKPADVPLTNTNKLRPYLYFLEYALQKRTQTQITIKVTRDQNGNSWYWSDIPVEGTFVRVGFERARVGAYPEMAFTIVMLSGVLVGIGTAVLLSHRLNRPLEKLADNIRKIGRGRNPRALPETGPPELVSVARSINAMNQQIQSLISDRTTLLAGLSHDLRSPLARVQLATEIMPQASDPSLKNQIERDLGEMNRLISECIAISRGLHQEKDEQVDIAQLARKLADDLKPRMIALHIDGTTSRFKIAAPPVGLGRVLSNLLANAVRHGGEGPIDIQLSRRGDVITIEILDRGPGIPAQYYDDIFQPFFRLDTPGTTAPVTGSGMGLFIVKQLANANGWQIELRSRAGGGTAACLTIDAP